MIVEKRSRLRRLFGFIAFRLIPVFLIVGILWTGYQVAQGLARRFSEQTEAGQRQPSYQQTATALALPQSTPAVGVNNGQIQLVAYQRPNAALQFETNTPLAPEATPVPAATLAPTLP